MQRTLEARRDRRGNPAMGFVAGAVGGLAAGWAMNRFHDLAGRLSEDHPSARGGDTGDGEGAGRQERGSGGQQDDPAPVKAADALSRRFTHHPLPDDRKAAAGTAVHYGYAAMMGGLYGMAADGLPAVSAGRGVPWALGLWLFGDELAVPALHLSHPPTEYPLATHARSLGAHVLYGVVTDTVRRVLRPTNRS